MKQTYSIHLVNQLTDECCDNIQECLIALGVDFYKSNRRIYGKCPVHEGDNPAAWNLYPEGDEVRGVWICRTHQCEKKFKKNFAGFVHGILTKQAGKPVHWTEAVKWMMNFLGYKSVSEVHLPDKQVLTKRSQCNALNRWNIKPKVTETKWDREKIRKKLKIPAQYFISRGFSPDILDRYDVGFYNSENRVLAPVYDPHHKFAVGFVGRSIYDKCARCHFWHDPKGECPTTVEQQVNCSKWKNSRGFEAANYLYNYWFAYKHIVETSTIILVEGPGDVWKLEEAGIHNAVALFGVNITDEQMTLIEASWCINVIVLLDNDDAGKRASEEIKKIFCRTHRLYFPAYDGKDIGELQTDMITSDVEPFLTRISQFNKEIGVT